MRRWFGFALVPIHLSKQQEKDSMMFDHEESELLDVVNSHDEVIDTIDRRDLQSLRQTPGRYLRAVEVFLQRSNGDVYLPRRSTQKKLFPGSLDLSAAGHLKSGESYEQALLRETREELALDATVGDFVLVTEFSPTPQVFYFRKLYLLQTDKSPQLSCEHVEFLWIRPEDLQATVERDLPAKDTLYEGIDTLIDFLALNTT